MRTDYVNVKLLTKGDYVSINHRIWKIVGLRRTKAQGVKRRCFRLDYVSGGRMPRTTKNYSYKCYEWENMTRALIRTCFPCYDSDCACVFDQVSN